LGKETRPTLTRHMWLSSDKKMIGMSVTESAAPLSKRRVEFFPTLGTLSPFIIMIALTKMYQTNNKYAGVTN